jgi:hypothetical protein
MSAGHFGILAVEANYFYAGTLKQPIEITKKEDEEPRLLVGKGDLVNLYKNGAIKAVDFGAPPIDILKEYQEGLGDKNATIPQRDPMTDALSKIIKAEAGVRKSG